jgi:hypothetical protein
MDIRALTLALSVPGPVRLAAGVEGEPGGPGSWSPILRHPAANRETKDGAHQVRHCWMPSFRGTLSRQHRSARARTLEATVYEILLRGEA